MAHRANGEGTAVKVVLGHRVLAVEDYSVQCLARGRRRPINRPDHMRARCVLGRTPELAGAAAREADPFAWRRLFLLPWPIRVWKRPMSAARGEQVNMWKTCADIRRSRVVRTQAPPAGCCIFRRWWNIRFGPLHADRNAHDARSLHRLPTIPFRPEGALQGSGTRAPREVSTRPQDRVMLVKNFIPADQGNMVHEVGHGRRWRTGAPRARSQTWWQHRSASMQTPHHGFRWRAYDVVVYRTNRGAVLIAVTVPP